MNQPQTAATILSNQQPENLTLAGDDGLRGRLLMSASKSARVGSVHGMSTAGSSRQARAKSHGARLAAARQAARKRAPDLGAPTACSFSGTGFPGQSLSVRPR
jgi:hypothetical protein